MGRQEGSGGARLIKMMEQFGHNTDMRTHIAKVTSIDPFAIRIEGDNDDIEGDSLSVMQSILPHERKIDINGTVTFNGVTDSMVGTDVKITFKEGYIKIGDEVWVLETNDEQKYHVIDKVVS
ncbi:DUF2577 family protein [Psychrobacillus sp. FSL K6-2365]|uniref:DUF2577 family protein n=1 Tax=Psychrobacillus sp. FSL K6-2365 TaxID=2921546 RepID=UPI0030F5F5D8